LKRISLKYDGKCIKCGRTISSGQEAYWEKDKGVWHLDCNSHGRERRHPTSKSLWIAVAAIVLLAFILGGLVLGPVFDRVIGEKPTITITTTVTTTIERTTTVTTTIKEGPQLPPPAKWLPRKPSDPEVINWTDAGKYVGQTRTVEGIIVRTYKSAKGTVFLNFHDPYKGYFYAVIFSGDLKNFPFQPEVFYKGKEVRVTGMIQLYEGSPEIIVKNPLQIEVANMGFNYP